MRPVHAIKRLHQTVQSRIGHLDFNELWPGFQPTRFALYDDKRACLDGEIFAKPATFYGNTALEHQGEIIAVWYVDKDTMAMDADLLASLLVHEMFHAHQTMKEDTRAPHEWKALALEPEAGNLTRKHRENTVLADLLKRPDDDAFALLGQLRSHRQTLYPETFAYETGVETHEGLAQYVEWRALDTLNPTKARVRRHEAEARLRATENLWPARHNHYDIGAGLAWVAHHLDRHFTHALGRETRSLHTLLFNDAEPRKETITPRADITALVKRVDLEAEARIDEVLSRPHECIEGAFSLAGFDPFNTVKRGRYVHANHIFAYVDNGETRYVYGPSVIEIDDAMSIKAIHVPQAR